MLGQAQSIAGQIRVYFVPADLKRVMLALTRVDTVGANEKERLPKQNALNYSQLLVGNITSQKGMGGYAPISGPRYRDWKAKYGRGAGKSAHWQLFGDLLKNITFWNVRRTPRTSTWQGGIPGTVWDSGGKSWFGKGNKGNKKRIASYARWGEFGRGPGKNPKDQGQPARPIFGPTGREYIDSGRADAEAGRSLANIMQGWR